MDEDTGRQLRAELNALWDFTSTIWMERLLRMADSEAETLLQQLAEAANDRLTSPVHHDEPADPKYIADIMQRTHQIYMARLGHLASQYGFHREAVRAARGK